MDQDKLSRLFAKMNNTRLLIFDTTPSTNDVAKREAAKNPDSDIIVIAREQSAGRGRLGRSFFSDPGGLYMSVSCRPIAKPTECAHFTALAALACADTITSLTGLKCDIKWPNDILIGGKKVCGILAEAVHSGASFYLVTGIGINVTNLVPKNMNAACLADFTDTPPGIGELAALAAQKLRGCYEAAITHRAELLNEYRRRCETLGREIICKKTGRLIGTATDIDENAGLIIETPDGRTLVKTFGEI